MKEGIFCVLVCMLMMFTAVYPISATTMSNKTREPLNTGNVLYVGGSGPNNYTRILDAFNAAVPGDTIFVYHGTYYENPIISKSISLIGENRDTTIIDGGGKEIVLRLPVNNVLLSGFTIQNSTENGVYIYGYNITVSGNIFTNNKIDIWLSRSNNTITQNMLNGGGLDIHYYYGRHNIVTDNYVKGEPLVYLEGKNNMMLNTEAGQIVLLDCQNIKVQNQTLHDTAYGMLIGGSTNCVISHSVISNCFIGMRLFRSDNNGVFSNTLTDNSAFGIQLLNSSDNLFTQNTISGSTMGGGLYIEYYSKFNNVFNNTFRANGNGIQSSSGPTIVTNNHLIQNDFGICLYNSSPTYKNDSANFSIIQENHISQGHDGEGIFLAGINHCNISQNTISDYRYGIHQMHCKENRIADNALSNNSWSGIRSDDSTNTLLLGNAIDTSIIGISLENSVSNNILSNSLQKNTHGMYLSASSNNTIRNNDLLKNSKGIELFQSNDNTINQNNFRRNQQPAFFLDCNNSWDANYWNRIRLLPYPIVGKKTITIMKIDFQMPAVNLDSHPALKPNTI